MDISVPVSSLAPVAVATARKVLNPSVFELIVLPTEQCNFRCTYCYEDFSVGKMSHDTVSALKKLIANRADGTCDLVLSWFGGEPLLASDVILEVTQQAKSLWSACGRSFTSWITTNAYRLEPDLFRALLEVGVRHYQITLDGSREVHNASRKRSDGDGTFDIIWGNLLEMEHYARANPSDEFEVSLRIHYDGASVFLHEPLFRDIATHFGRSGRFSINLHEIERLGGSGDENIIPVGDLGREQVKKYVQILRDAGISKFVAADLRDYVCYASRANSLIVRADGRLSKCTVALTDPRNNVGRLLPDGNVEVSNQMLLPWLRGLFSGDPHELACPRLSFTPLRDQEPALVKLGERRDTRS